MTTRVNYTVLTMHVASVEETAAWYERVVAQGWPVDSGPQDQFWGERLFRLKDLNGHPLVITQPVEELGLDEIRRRSEALREA